MTIAKGPQIKEVSNNIMNASQMSVIARMIRLNKDHTMADNPVLVFPLTFIFISVSPLGG